MISIRLAVAVAILALAVASCTPAEFRAANDALERQMNQYPGGALGWCIDAALLSHQINTLRGR